MAEKVNVAELSEADRVRLAGYLASMMAVSEILDAIYNAPEDDECMGIARDMTEMIEVEA